MTNDAAQADHLWYILQNSKQYGPYTFATLVEAVETRVITDDTLLWRPGWGTWRPAAAISGLFEFSDEAARAEALHVAGQLPVLLPPPPAPGLHMSYVARHWRGELPLAVSFWVNTALLSIGMVIAAITAPHIQFDTKPLFPTSFLAIVVYGAMLCTTVVWQVVGLWRSADRMRVQSVWGMLARASVAFVLLLLIGSIGLLVRSDRSAPIPMPEPPSPVLSDKKPLAKPDPAAPPTAAQRVLTLPVFAVLNRTDPVGFDQVARRLNDAPADSPEDEVLTLARNAVRKSLRTHLPNADAEAVLELTDIALSYMEALRPVDPESCVALSDESRGAMLRANLARQFPDLLRRELAVGEQALLTPQAAAVIPSSDEAQVHLEKVLAWMQSPQLRLELYDQKTLDPADYQPYCDLVIAFYRGVRSLSDNDAVELLRYLYSLAAK